MNTTDTQHVNKAHAANGLSPAESQVLQSSLLAMAQAHGDGTPSGPPGLSATPTLTGLLQALRRRWMIGVSLACVSAACLGIAVFFLLPARYQASIRLRVVARVPGVDDIEFPIFKANMEALVKSPLVLNAALNDKTADGRDVKDLEIVRSKGMGAIDGLERALKTDYLMGPEVLRVTLAADQPDEAAELLNAIAKAFLNEYAEMERSKKQQRLAELRSKKERNEEELRMLRNMLANQYKQLAVKDQEQANVQTQTLLHQHSSVITSIRGNEDALSKVDSKLVTYKARLANLDKTTIPDKVLSEVYSRTPELTALHKRIIDIQDQIDRNYAEYAEPILSQRVIPLKHEKIRVLKQKEDKEAQLKPTIEEHWRRELHDELATQIAIAGEEIKELRSVRDRLAKESVDLELKIKNGNIGKSSSIIATEDKIEMSRMALNQTAQKISEVELEVPGSRIQPLQGAIPPTAKDRSQQTKIAGAGGLGVFIMALFGVAFLEFRARRIHLPEEVALGLGLNVVGTIPAMPGRSKKSDGAAEQAWQHQLQESVDTIRTVLMHQARTQALHVIMVTSASKGEGKTTLATQLAASLSRAWKRVLVIDGDLRHSAAHKLFDVPQEPGLAEVLRGEVEATDAIRATSLSRLWVLPAGNGDAHAIQALAQENVRTLFEQFKQQYDFIIIDTPPVLPVTDSLLLGQHVDGVLFAVLKDVSRAPAIYAAQQKLAPLDVHMLGAVVLGADAEFTDKTYGYAHGRAAK